MSLDRKHQTDDRLTTAKEFAGVASDLTDKEIGDTIRIINQARRRWAGKANSPENLEQLRDEVLTKLADINILATLDPTPCFYGEPPTIEIIGKVASDPIYRYGFDHEKKMHEVRRAVELGEDYRGQKESYDKRKDAE